MMFDEPLPRSSRPYISSSLSAPAFSTFSSNGSPNPNPRFSPSPSPSPSPSSSSSYKNPRSSSASLPSSAAFSYNYRIAIALIPAAAFLLDLGGAPVAATLTLTLMIAYILDSLHLKSASFFAVWFALIASQIAFFFSSGHFSLFPSVPLSLAALLLCGETNFLVGVWASLQFRYILIENSAIVPALERLLFACVPIVVPPLFTWASVSATGLCPATAYHLAAFCAVSYWLFSLPRSSSFRSKQELARGRDAAGEESYILSPLESCLHTLNLLFLPVAFHVASHHSTIFSSASSVSDLLLLFFLPFLFLLYASTRGALWWVTRDGQQVHQIRVVNGAVALVVVVICLEIRVIFHAFGKYLHVPPPLNYLLVTIAMLGGASGVAAYALGMVNDAVSSVAFTALSILVSGAGAVVVGFPVYVSI